MGHFESTCRCSQKHRKMEIKGFNDSKEENSPCELEQIEPSEQKFNGG